MIKFYYAVAPNPNNLSADELGQVLANYSAGAELGGSGAAIVPELIGYAKQKGALGALAQGAMLKRMLPIAVELYNTAGVFQFTIPADNRTVVTVLDACKGDPWWEHSATVAGGSSPSPAASLPAEERYSALLRDVTSRAYIATMKSDLRNLVTAEESFFADSSRYVAYDTTRLKFKPASGVNDPVIVPGADHWSATVTHTQLPGLLCGIGVNTLNPIDSTKGGGEAACKLR